MTEKDDWTTAEHMAEDLKAMQKILDEHKPNILDNLFYLGFLMDSIEKDTEKSKEKK